MGVTRSSGARVVLDPTSEARPARRERPARPRSLEGLTVGLLDISKPRGDVFLDRLHQKSCDFDASRGLVMTIAALQYVDETRVDDHRHGSS